MGGVNWLCCLACEKEQLSFERWGSHTVSCLCESFMLIAYQRHGFLPAYAESILNPIQCDVPEVLCKRWLSCIDYLWSHSQCLSEQLLPFLSLKNYNLNGDKMLWQIVRKTWENFNVDIRWSANSHLDHISVQNPLWSSHCYYALERCNLPFLHRCDFRFFYQ